MEIIIFGKKIIIDDNNVINEEQENGELKAIGEWTEQGAKEYK